MIGRLLASFALFAALSACSGACLAADEGQKEAEEKLQKLLDDSNSFYKTEESDGSKIFIVLIEDDDGASKVVVAAEQVGSVGDTPIYGYRSFTVAASVAEGESFPPDVIKLVTKVNRVRPLGFVGITDDMSIIVSYNTGVIDGTSARALSMANFYVHRNKVMIRKEIQRILSERSE